jgi:hypothetical protein
VSFFFRASADLTTTSLVLMMPFAVAVRLEQHVPAAAAGAFDLQTGAQFHRQILRGVVTAWVTPRATDAGYCVQSVTEQPETLTLREAIGRRSRVPVPVVAGVRARNNLAAIRIVN